MSQLPLRIVCVFFGFALGIAPCLAAPASPDKAAAVQPSRHFQFTYVVDVPATAGRELRLWVPLPQDDRYQTISALHVDCPVPYRVERSAGGNADAYVVLTGPQLQKPIEIRIQFETLRRERTTRLLAHQRSSGNKRDSGKLQPGCLPQARPDDSSQWHNQPALRADHHGHHRPTREGAGNL